MDDLQDVSKLEAHVEESEVILIVVTDQYLSSYNCRRELVAAMKCRKLGKPLVLLCESDEKKGAASVTQLRAELHALKSGGKFDGSDDELDEDAGLAHDWERPLWSETRRAACDPVRDGGEQVE